MKTAGRMHSIVSAVFQPSHVFSGEPAVRCRQFLLGAGLLACTLAAQGQPRELEAWAYQNLGFSQTTTSTGASTSAAVPPLTEGGYARVTAARTVVDTDVLGWGARATTHLDAVGSADTSYQLWNLDESRALTALEAAPLRLNFNFRLTGSLATEEVSLSSASVDYTVYLFSDGNDRAHDGVVHGFGPGPGGDQYLTVGNVALVGGVDQPFSLLHTNSADGWYSVLLQTAAFNQAAARFRLALESVSLVGGVTTASERVAAAAASPAPFALGVRLLETGDLLMVGGAATAVPEPATLLLVAAALAASALRRRGAAA